MPVVTVNMAKFPAKDLDEALIGLAAAVGSALGYVEEQVIAVTAAVIEKKPDEITVVDEYYREVRKISTETAGRAIETVLRFKPAPEDMRMIIASWRISAELERAALCNKEISQMAAEAKIDLFAGAETGIKNLCDRLIGQTSALILAYTGDEQENADFAHAQAEILKTIYSGFFRQTLTYVQENPKLIADAQIILEIAKNFCAIGVCMREIINNLRYKFKKV